MVNAFLDPGLGKEIKQGKYLSHRCWYERGTFELSFHSLAADGMVLDENQTAHNLKFFLVALIVNTD